MIPKIIEIDGSKFVVREWFVQHGSLGSEHKFKDPLQDGDVVAILSQVAEPVVKQETPEEAAKKYAIECHGEPPKEMSMASEVHFIDATTTARDFLAGCEWAKKNMGEK